HLQTEWLTRPLRSEPAAASAAPSRSVSEAAAAVATALPAILEMAERRDMVDFIGLIRCWLGMALNSGISFLKTIGNKIPIDDIEKRGDVVRPAVLVLQVIGVLPDIDSQQGNRMRQVHAEAPGERFRRRRISLGGCADRRILVRSGNDRQFLARFEHQPGPTAAESANGGFAELLFETAETLEFLVNGGCQFTLGLASTAFLHHLPE